MSMAGTVVLPESIYVYGDLMAFGDGFGLPLLWEHRPHCH